MKIRMAALVGVTVLLTGAGLAFPTTAAALGPFTCGTQSGGNPGVSGVQISAVRVGRHDSESPAYDRFVVEFEQRAPDVPPWKAIPKSSANFTLSPSGMPVTLLGTAGIRLDLLPGIFPAYPSGQTDFKTGFPQLAEARQLGAWVRKGKWRIFMR